MRRFKKTVYWVTFIFSAVLVTSAIASFFNDLPEDHLPEEDWTEPVDTANVIVLVNWTGSTGRIGRDWPMPSYWLQLRDTVSDLLSKYMTNPDSAYYLRVSYAYFGLVSKPGKPKADFRRNYIKVAFANESGYSKSSWDKLRLNHLRGATKGLNTALSVAGRMALVECSGSLISASRNYVLLITDNFRTRAGLTPMDELSALDGFNEGVRKHIKSGEYHPDSAYKFIDGIDYARETCSKFETLYRLTPVLADSLLYSIEDVKREDYVIVSLNELVPVLDRTLDRFLDIKAGPNVDFFCNDYVAAEIELSIKADEISTCDRHLEWLRFDYKDGGTVTNSKKFVDSVMTATDHFALVAPAGDITNDSVVVTGAFSFPKDDFFGKFEEHLTMIRPVSKNKHSFALLFEVKGSFLDAVNWIPLMTAGAATVILNLMFMVLLVVLVGVLGKRYIWPGSVDACVVARSHHLSSGRGT